MKKYRVRISFDGWRFFEIEAENKQEAFDKAWNMPFDANEIDWQLNTEFRDEELDIEELKEGKLNDNSDD